MTERVFSTVREGSRAGWSSMASTEALLWSAPCGPQGHMHKTEAGGLTYINICTANTNKYTPPANKHTRACACNHTRTQHTHARALTHTHTRTHKHACMHAHAHACAQTDTHTAQREKNNHDHQSQNSLTGSVSVCLSNTNMEM